MFTQNLTKEDAASCSKLKMKNKKAIAIDLDGTLFDNNKKISQYNVDTLNDCYENDCSIIIATARPLRTVLKKLPQDLRYSYLILCNGAWIMKNKAIISKFEIESNIVNYLVNKLKIIGLKPAIEANDNFYTDGELDPGFDGHYFSLNEYPNINACKVLAYEQYGIDKNIIDSILPKNIIGIITDAGTLLQISSKKCSKELACKEIFKMESIKLECTFAFGDDVNDIPMFNSVGYGIAMKNADDRLKEIANEITETNENNGVGKWLEKNILKNIAPLSS